MTRKFLLILLLCMPMISRAANETPVAQYKDIDNGVKSISDATSISDAATKYETEFNKVANYYGNVVKSGTISNERKNMQELKNNALNGNSVTSANTGSQSAGSESGNAMDGAPSEKLADAKKKYEDAKATEQSTANKTLTALTTAATGIGGMELARGLSEQKADKDAANDMAAYIATMRCTYGEGKSVKAGTAEIELPGGNNQQLMNYRAEYLALANDLKERKNALGMKAGIESEEILDKSTMGLYDDENTGITSGAYASRYRATILGSETDQAELDSEQKAAKNRVIAGAVVGGVGVVGGAVGDSLINGKLGELIKEKKNAKESSKENDEIIKNWKQGLNKTGMKNVNKLNLSNFDMIGTKDVLSKINFEDYDLSKFDALKDIDINNGEKSLGNSLGNLFVDTNKKTK